MNVICNFLLIFLLFYVNIYKLRKVDFIKKVNKVLIVNGVLKILFMKCE